MDKIQRGSIVLRDVKLTSNGQLGARGSICTRTEVYKTLVRLGRLDRAKPGLFKSVAGAVDVDDSNAA